MNSKKWLVYRAMNFTQVFLTPLQMPAGIVICPGCVFCAKHWCMAKHLSLCHPHLSLSRKLSTVSFPVGPLAKNQHRAGAFPFLRSSSCRLKPAFSLYVNTIFCFCLAWNAGKAERRALEERPKNVKMGQRKRERCSRLSISMAAPHNTSSPLLES